MVRVEEDGAASNKHLGWGVIRRLEEESFTVFVDNLPSSMSKGWLYQLFGFEGIITEVYMSRKRRRVCSSPFAFVRFAKRGNAESAIKKFERNGNQGP